MKKILKEKIVIVENNQNDDYLKAAIYTNNDFNNFIKKKKNSNNKNIEPISSHSKKYDFGNRDIYYMPWFVNHVGYTEDISIGVSLWFQSTDNYSYSKKILSRNIK